MFMGGFKQLSLQEKKNRDCVFWKDGGCSVYPARPVQCKTYPFWQHIVGEDDGWQRESLSCPGIGTGGVWTERKVKSMLRERTRELPLVLPTVPEAGA